ncbi:MAG: hypothetical protein ACOCXM_00865 [Myxococcota bacterium]
MSRPLDVLRERLPALFEGGVAQLRQRAETGDAAARVRLDDVTGARSALRLVVEGDGELWIGVEGGQLTAGATRPEGLPVRLAVAVPSQAVQSAFDALPEGAAEDDRVAHHLVAMASKRAEGVIEGQRLDFHVCVEDVPDLGTVVARVAVGAEEPPETPRFTATLRHEDLEQARERRVDPQQFLMGGRVRFAGDYVPALQLGMQLAQAMQPPRGGGVP